MAKSSFPATSVHNQLITKENINLFESQLRNFTSKDKNINTVIHSKIELLKNKAEYDNRNQIMAYFADDSKEDSPVLIGVIVYAASCIKTSFRSGGDLIPVVFPCVRIETFGVNESMTKKYAEIHFPNGQDPLPCAKFIMEHFLDYLDKQSYRVGITHVHLNAVHKDGVTKFYEDCNFRKLTRSEKSFGLDGDDRDYSYICTLKNAINREYPQINS
jgi:hypothetical protein